MAYVEVPRDLNKIKTKVVGPLTKRQLIGFVVAGVIGFPTYFGLKKFLPDEIALIALIFVSAPAILVAVYEKDGIPAEEIFKSWLKFKFLKQSVRKYKTTKQNHFLERGIRRVKQKSASKKTRKRIRTVNPATQSK